MSYFSTKEEEGPPKIPENKVSELSIKSHLTSVRKPHLPACIKPLLSGSFRPSILLSLLFINSWYPFFALRDGVFDALPLKNSRQSEIEAVLYTSQLSN